MTEKEEMIKLGLKTERTIAEEIKLMTYIKKEARRRYIKMLIRDMEEARKKKLV